MNSPHEEGKNCQCNCAELLFLVGVSFDGQYWLGKITPEESRYLVPGRFHQAGLCVFLGGGGIPGYAVGVPG